MIVLSPKQCFATTIYECATWIGWGLFNAVCS